MWLLELMCLCPDEQLSKEFSQIYEQHMNLVTAGNPVKHSKPTGKGYHDNRVS